VSARKVQAAGMSALSKIMRQQARSQLPSVSACDAVVGCHWVVTFQLLVQFGDGSRAFESSNTSCPRWSEIGSLLRAENVLAGTLISEKRNVDSNEIGFIWSTCRQRMLGQSVWGTDTIEMRWALSHLWKQHIERLDGWWGVKLKLGGFG
jgi:hypothetical protein